MNPFFCLVERFKFIRFDHLRLHTQRTRKALCLIAVLLLFLDLLAVLPAFALSAPTITPSTGSFTNTQTVTMSASSGTIYFTTDGTKPSNLSTQYSSSFTISSPTQINAVAYLSGTYSPVTTVYLDVDSNLAPVLQAPGLVLRLRAGLGVSADPGSPASVNQWADLSGNSNNLTATFPKRPLFLNSSINSYPALSFDGTSQFMSLPSNSINFSTVTQIAISDAPPFQSNTLTITINGSNNANYSITTSDTNQTIATGLASAINALSLSGVSAAASGSIIQVTAPLGTTYASTTHAGIYINIQAAGMTLFVVTNPSSLSANSEILDLADAGIANEFRCQIAASASKGQLTVIKSGSGSTNVQSASALTQNQFQVLAAVESSGASNGTATFYLNGVPGTQSTSMNNIPVVTWANNFLAQSSSTGSFYGGQICELLLYSTALNSSQISAVQTMLMQKYGILSQTPEAPIISVPTSSLLLPTQVTIAAETGAMTTYTTDGSTPTVSSTAYLGCPISINYSQTLKAASFKNGVTSAVSTATYTLDSTLWPAPSPSDLSTPSLTLQLPTPSL